MTTDNDYHLAPGNVLQNMYLKKRLAGFTNSSMKFIELGPGNGYISNILLRLGLNGIGYDLSDSACNNNRSTNIEYIKSGTYSAVNADFFGISEQEKVDIIISSHVLEHVPTDELDTYFEKCKSILNKNGKIITLVPSSMKHWGIEDETVGHYRRFEFGDFEGIAKKHNLNIDNIAGLTFPLSNILFKLSNHLLNKSESWKKNLSKEEQTVLSSSGVKNVKYKTYFPSYFRYLINDITMYPFHLLQLLNRHNASSMVIYCEFSATTTA